MCVSLSFVCLLFFLLCCSLVKFDIGHLLNVKSVEEVNHSSKYYHNGHAIVVSLYENVRVKD